ncbi:MAG: hypothetical protein AB1938_20390 [Myxococcota bacterium]
MIHSKLPSPAVLTPRPAVAPRVVEVRPPPPSPARRDAFDRAAPKPAAKVDVSTLPPAGNSGNGAHDFKVLVNNTLVEVAKELGVLGGTTANGRYRTLNDVSPAVREQVMARVAERLQNDPRLPPNVTVEVENEGAGGGADRLRFSSPGQEGELIVDCIKADGTLKTRIAKNYLAEADAAFHRVDEFGVRRGFPEEAKNAHYAVMTAIGDAMNAGQGVSARLPGRDESLSERVDLQARVHQQVLGVNRRSWVHLHEGNASVKGFVDDMLTRLTHFEQHPELYARPDVRAEVNGWLAALRQLESDPSKGGVKRTLPGRGNVTVVDHPFSIGIPLAQVDGAPGARSSYGFR